MSARVRLEVADGVATVTLDAPERGNSVDEVMLAGLEQILQGLEAEVRAVVLTGAGQRSFSTGYHVPSLLEELSRGESVSDFEDHPLERALRALEAVPVPTVAVLNGHAYGAGCELALTCDLRLAAAEARLCMPPARLGVLYSATGIRRLLELVGPAFCRELLFLGEPVDAARALAMGLVNRVAPRQDLAGLAEGVVGSLVANAPLSLRHTKTILTRYLASPELDAEVLRLVAGLREECFRSPEFARRTQALGREKSRGKDLGPERSGS